MTKEQINQIVAANTSQDGLTETGISGVRLFRATQSLPCIPAVYDPCIIVIVNGTKEAVLDGHKYVYDNSQYLCCPISMPIKAGTPNASPADPLYGVQISLDARIMSQLVMETENADPAPAVTRSELRAAGIKLATWDDGFSDALLRLLHLTANPLDRTILGEARLREVLFAVLKGDAGPFARQAFGAGNAIARSIAHVAAHLDSPVSIDDMAQRAGMSRAAFHRQFKHATTMAPIQFVKSMRLNNAAMKIASGMTVNEAARDVGYVSPSQFSREFKRMYGTSPKHWSNTHSIATEAV